MKRKGEEDLQWNDKRRRLDPLQWSSEEVKVYLKEQTGILPTTLNKVCDYDGRSLKEALDCGAWGIQLAALPLTHRRALLEAGNDLFDDLMAKFLLYDSDGSGTLEEDEFRHLAHSVTGKIISDAEFRSLMGAADLNGDGGISFPEFKKFVKNTNSAVAVSLRDSVLESLLSTEAALLSSAANLFSTTPSPALTPSLSSPMQRLTLTAQARTISTFMSAVLMGLLVVLAFPVILKLSDIAIPKQINFDALLAPGQQINPEYSACKDFLLHKCGEWSSDRKWSNKDYRQCAKKVHPDKARSGHGSDYESGGQDFIRLTFCNDFLKEYTEQPRNNQFVVLLGLYSHFTFNFVIVAAGSSVSAALAYAARTVLDPSSVKILEFSDLAESFRIFVLLFAGTLALVTCLLSATRDQSSLGGWLAGARICDIRSGQPVGLVRALSLDFLQFLCDLAIMTFFAAILRYVVSDKALLSTPPALLIFVSVWAQMALSWIFKKRFDSRNVAEYFAGTIQICNRKLKKE